MGIEVHQYENNEGGSLRLCNVPNSHVGRMMAMGAVMLALGGTVEMDGQRINPNGCRACPKCGKRLMRIPLQQHVKACKGTPDDR